MDVNAVLDLLAAFVPSCSSGRAHVARLGHESERILEMWSGALKKPEFGGELVHANLLVLMQQNALWLVEGASSRYCVTNLNLIVEVNSILCFRR